MHYQGRRPEVLFEGGGGGFISTQTHLPSKFSFSSDFGQAVFKKWWKKQAF